MHDNLAYIFNGNKFEVKSKDYVLSDLLNNHLGNIKTSLRVEDNEINSDDSNEHGPSLHRLSGLCSEIPLRVIIKIIIKKFK